MSNCCANSASVLSPRTAAKATFALKAGVWFRRGRLVIVSPGLQPFWLLSGRNSTYPDVQISWASSLEFIATKDFFWINARRQGNRAKPIKSFLRTAVTLWVMSPADLYFCRRVPVHLPHNTYLGQKSGLSGIG